MASEQFSTRKRDFFNSFSIDCFDLKINQLVREYSVTLGGGARTGLICLRIGTGGRHL
jgi:hypothetical protein